jgi:hypothetical protein
VRKHIFCMIGILFLLPYSVWCGDLYVQSNTAPVFDKPTLSGVKLMVLQQGMKVTGLKKEGMWQQVQHNNATGWVYALMLSPSPPLAPSDIASGQMDQMAATARKRPSAYASTAAARGLLNQRNRLGQRFDYNYDALKKMESYAADPKEILKFIKEREPQ